MPPGSAACPRWPTMPACASMPLAVCPACDTAFYATQFGYAKGDDNNVRALLEQMHDIDNRRAAMVSTLVALRSADDPEPLIAVGRVVGEIAREPMGSNGFGFDPVMFIPEFGKTFAAVASGSQERQQPPRPCGARHGGADARALVGMTHPVRGHFVAASASKGIHQWLGKADATVCLAYARHPALHAPRHAATRQPAAAVAVCAPALVPQKVPLLRLQLA